jgi:hypothetical protein
MPYCDLDSIHSSRPALPAISLSLAKIPAHLALPSINVDPGFALERQAEDRMNKYYAHMHIIQQLKM